MLWDLINQILVGCPSNPNHWQCFPGDSLQLTSTGNFQAYIATHGWGTVTVPLMASLLWWLGLECHIGSEGRYSNLHNHSFWGQLSSPSPYLYQGSLNTENADEAGAFVLVLRASLLPPLQPINQLCLFILRDLPWMLSYQVWLPYCFMATALAWRSSSHHCPYLFLHHPPFAFASKEQSVIILCNSQYKISQ